VREREVSRALNFARARTALRPHSGTPNTPHPDESTITLAGQGTAGNLAEPVAFGYLRKTEGTMAGDEMCAACGHKKSKHEFHRGGRCTAERVKDNEGAITQQFLLCKCEKFVSK
jgi:hypothetical protein